MLKRDCRVSRRALLLVFLPTVLMASPTAFCEGDLTRQDPVELTVQLGDKTNALRFEPDDIQFETGRLYKLVLFNPSSIKHYFSSEGFSRAVFTRKVQINGSDGKPISEIKGWVREIEVYPGARAEWWFVPVKTGRFNDLKCTIPGHSEGGMVGSILIE